MLSKYIPPILLALLVVFNLQSGLAQSNEVNPIKGPNGVEILPLFKIYNDAGDKAITALQITQEGNIINTIKGEPFIWRRILLNEGNQIAVETGPLHFVMHCLLIDISSGKIVDHVDCFQYPKEPPPRGWPSWVDTLLQNHKD